MIYIRMWIQTSTLECACKCVQVCVCVCVRTRARTFARICSCKNLYTYMHSLSLWLSLVSNHGNHKTNRKNIHHRKPMHLSFMITTSRIMFHVISRIPSQIYGGWTFPDSFHIGHYIYYCSTKYEMNTEMLTCPYKKNTYRYCQQCQVRSPEFFHLIFSDFAI